MDRPSPVDIRPSPRTPGRCRLWSPDPAVKAGGRFPYSEQIDIVPTLTYLMGVKPPDNAMGRIMAEALTNPPANVPPRQER